MSEDIPKLEKLTLSNQQLSAENNASNTPKANSTTTSPSKTSSSPNNTSANQKRPSDSRTIPGIKVEYDGDRKPPSRSSSPFSQKDGISPHIKSAGSSTSLTHLSTHRSTTSRTPMGSMLELKRFFGKGRKKHEHGVSHTPRQPLLTPSVQVHQVPQAQVHQAQVQAQVPHNQHVQNLPPHHSLEKSKHHSLSSIFGLGKHHHKEKHEPLEYSAALAHSTAASDRDFGDMNHPVVLGKPPADLDPNFVVHGPDYEADWDPFHVFGMEPNSERLPFLESGITKYGEVGRNMGSGAGGSVRMMERPSDHKVFAVKEFRKRRANESMQKYAKTMTAEYALGAALHHKNIIETIDLIKEGDKYYEVMEYGSHDFFEMVMSGEMSTAQINSAFRQIFDGVKYLHSMGVAHRDIKLDNCVVNDEGVIKLIDFGSAVIFRYPLSPKIHLARGILGSDPYLAPEVFERKPYQPQCADIWSCGIIYCCEYLRRFPWKLPKTEDASYRKFAENPANVDGEHPHQENARKITGPWRVLRLLPRDSRKILSRILTIEVKTRATLDEIYADPWFSSIETISVLPKSSK